MSEQREIWRYLTAPDTKNILYTVMRRAVGTLSNMTGWIFKVEDIWVERIPLSQITTAAGDPESEVVGIYLRVEEGLGGHALLTMTVDDALNLVDALLANPPNTTVSLNSLEHSALAEIGNLMISYFLNAVADIVHSDVFFRPSPPAVKIDMLGSLLNTAVIPLAGTRDDLLVLGTTFAEVSGASRIRFWVLPDYGNQDLKI